MALNRAFKVKDDINVLGRILSAGTDLFDIFSDQTASFQVSAANATFQVSGGDAFKLLGDNGVIVAANSNTETLIISGKNASYTEKGVSQFSSTNFTVTDGSVSVASQGILNSNLDPNAVDKDVINPSDIVYNAGAISFSTTAGFSANVDNSSIEIATNKLQIKDDGVTKSKIADNSIDKELVDASDIVYNAGAISFSNAVGFSANVDNSSIEIAANKLQVKSGGITNGMLVNDSITFGDGTNSGATALGSTFEIKGTQNQITATFNNLTNDNVTLSFAPSAVFPGDVTVEGALFVAGSATFRNTLVTTSSALSVINTGPSPALYVRNTNNAYDIASFYDGDYNEVLHVGGGGAGLGAVGINVGTVANGGTQPELVGLTVNGSISANEIIYTLNWGDSRDWWSVFTTVQGASASWSGGGGGSAYISGLSARWESNWNNTNANSGYWQDTYSYVLAKSATWDTVSTNITADNINLRDTSTAVGRINFGQNTSKLAAPVQYGVNDKITLWDFKGTGTGWNYAIGAEGSNMWFTVDANTNTGGFKFYIRDDLNFWLRGDGNLILKDNKDIFNTTGTSLLLVTKDRADTTFSTVNSNSASWGATYSYVGAQSAKWDTAYTTTAAESAKWNDTYSYVYSNSANFLVKDTPIQVTSVTLNDSGKTSLRKIYTGSATGTDFFSVATFAKASYNSAKFIVTVKNVTDNYRTSFEVMAVKTNGSGAWDGTVYAIVDQNNMFRQVDVDTSGTTVDLQITMYAVKNYIVNVLVDAISD